MSIKHLQITDAENTEAGRQGAIDQMAKNEAAIQLLRSWRESSEEDRQEQQETWEYLKRVLDEDRLSDRKLFP